MTHIRRYRKKPIEIEAQKYIGSKSRVRQFVPDDILIWEIQDDNELLYIKTLEGDMLVRIGDYIIKGVAGEFYPCKPEIFNQTYEAIDKLSTDDFKSMLEENLTKSGRTWDDLYYSPDELRKRLKKGGEFMIWTGKRDKLVFKCIETQYYDETNYKITIKKELRLMKRKSLIFSHTDYILKEALVDFFNNYCEIDYKDFQPNSLYEIRFEIDDEGSILDYKATWLQKSN